MSDSVKKGPFGRPMRVPLGTRNVLRPPQRKGFVRRVVNVEPGRVQDFEKAGYKVVTGDVEMTDPKVGKENMPGSPVHISVGAGTKAILMEIREDWYKEDQKSKHDKILAAENDMKHNLNKKGQGTYGNVSIT